VPNSTFSPAYTVIAEVVIADAVAASPALLPPHLDSGSPSPEAFAGFGSRTRASGPAGPSPPRSAFAPPSRLPRRSYAAAAVAAAGVAGEDGGSAGEEGGLEAGEAAARGGAESLSPLRGERVRDLFARRVLGGLL
jgi:hypothetical protein